jgi:hypothetical protein
MMPVWTPVDFFYRGVCVATNYYSHSLETPSILDPF